MDITEIFSLLMLVLAYIIIIMLIVIYEVTECQFSRLQQMFAEAMQDIAQANFQMKFDHMFAGVPMYDGTDPDTFDD